MEMAINSRMFMKMVLIFTVHYIQLESECSLCLDLLSRREGVGEFAEDGVEGVERHSQVRGRIARRPVQPEESGVAQ